MTNYELQEALIKHPNGLQIKVHIDNKKRATDVVCVFPSVDGTLHIVFPESMVVK